MGAVLVFGTFDTLAEEEEKANRAPVVSNAARLNAVFEGAEVTKHWLAGRNIVWETGDPDGTPVGPVGHHTHCSAFVAAVCARLGIYILRPPKQPAFLPDVQHL